MALRSPVGCTVDGDFTCSVRSAGATQDLCRYGTVDIFPFTNMIIVEDFHLEVDNVAVAIGFVRDHVGVHELVHNDEG